MRGPAIDGMRLIRASAFALVACIAASAPQPLLARTGKVLAISVEGRRLSVPITLETTTIDPKGDHEIRVIASRGGILTVLDSYASKPQAMSRCRAGSERWLRVIDAVASRERYARLVESCLKDVVPGDPLLTGPDTAGTITINMSSEPSFRIAADGRVEDLR